MYTVPFLTEKVPPSQAFIYLLLTNDAPFTNFFIALCIPINCCKWTVFKIWINHKTRMFFSTISQPKKFICKPFWFFFTDRNDRFPYPLRYFNKWNPDTFIYLKPEIGTHLERSLPLWAIIGSTPGDLYASVLPAHPADQTVIVLPVRAISRGVNVFCFRWKTSLQVMW